MTQVASTVIGGKTCSIEGCEKQGILVRTWCSKHYARWKRHRDPNYYHFETDIQKHFESKLSKGEGCWFLEGIRPGKHGYVSVYFEGSSVRGHRASYAFYKGEIPSDMQVDHMCRVRHCVNPSHLQLVTPKENAENISLRKDNSTGVRGVQRRGKRYRTVVGHNGKKHTAGTFDTLEEAEQAVISLRNRLHTNNLEDRS